MIVTCSNCNTKYNLPEDKIAPGGSKVKCSKCGHQFKVDPPKPAEDEVEALLEDEAPAPETDAGDAFDEEFDEALAQDAAAGETTAPDEDAELDIEEPAEGESDTGVDAPPTDDFGDLFDDQEELETPEGESVLEGDEGDLFEETADAQPEEAEEEDEGDLGGLFDDEEEEGEDEGDDIFDEEDEDEDDEEEDDDLFEDLDLDEKPKRRGLGLIIVLLLVALVAAGVYFQAWKWVGLDLSGSLGNVPLVGSLFTDGDMPDADPGESPEQKVNKIELDNVRQFYVKNEKVGVLFVIQGTAVNKFPNPKERIKVQAELFDAQTKVVASQTLLCGNQLSMFQLQVQTREEIEEGLTSEVGVLSNNTFLRPGASTPFMFVFFDQPMNDIKEFGVKVVDAQNPE